MRLQLEKLNKYIFKETETKTSLEKNYDLTTNDFIESLKVNVMEKLTFFKLILIRKRKDTLFNYKTKLRW